MGALGFWELVSYVDTQIGIVAAVLEIVIANVLGVLQIFHLANKLITGPVFDPHKTFLCHFSKPPYAKIHRPDSP
jgi:hypothetical protein